MKQTGKSRFVDPEAQPSSLIAVPESGDGTDSSPTAKPVRRRQTPPSSTVRQAQRKRGDTLEQEIFAAVFCILQSDGYAALNFSQVAQRAHTSRTVLYRRWSTIPALVYEAMQNRFETHGHQAASLSDDADLSSGRLPTDGDSNMGRLRNELLQLLHSFNDSLPVTGQTLPPEQIPWLVDELVIPVMLNGARSVAIE